MMLSIGTIALTLLATLPQAVPAQAAARLARTDARAPRFLGLVAGKPIAIEITRVPLLARRVDEHVEGVTLSRVLRDLAAKTGTRIAFSRDVAGLDRRVRLNVQGLTLAAALTELLFDQELDVVIDGERLLIVTRAPEPPPPPVGTVRGSVVDSASRAAVAGAQVVVVGTAAGTTTGSDGRFALVDVPAGSHIVQVRHIGYRAEARTVTVADRQSVSLDFTLARVTSVLDEVVVAGTVVESRKREVPVPVGVLNEEQLRVPLRTRIDQLFRGDVPGIIGIEGHPTQSGSYMFVRGRASLDVENLVKVYVDGVELPTTALISSLDLQNVERIELLRGPQASTLYGSNASGGVLLVFTKNGRAGGPRLSGSAGFGTMGSHYADHTPMAMQHRLTLGGGGQGFTYSLGGSYLSTGEFVEQGDTRQVGLNGRGTFTQGPFHFSLTSTYSNRVLGWVNPPSFGEAGLGELLPEYVTTRNTDITTSNQLLGGSVAYVPNERWTTAFSMGWNGITDRGNQYRPQRATPEDTLYDQWLEAYDQHSARLNSTLSVPLSPGVRSTTTGGVDLSRTSHEYFEAHVADRMSGAGPENLYIVPPQVSHNQGYFVQEVLGFGDRFFFTGAVRAERNSNFAEDEGVVWAPRAGLAYVFNLTTGVMVKPRVSYGKSLRPPSPSQAVGANFGFYVQRPNPRLRSEVQRGFDGGFDLDVHSGMVEVEATYFAQTAKNLIAEIADYTVEPIATQFQNVGTVANHGVEVGLRLRRGMLELTSSYTYAKSEVKGLSNDYQGDLQVGDQLTYAPRHSGGGTLALNLPAFMRRRSRQAARLELGVTYIGRRVTDDQIAVLTCLYLGQCVDDTPSLRDYWVTLPSVVKIRAGASHPVRDGVDLFVNVDNLSNRQEGEFYKLFPSRGRSVLFGLRFGQ